ncbi:hypothetical protein CC79DRAFT_1359296 [Sarocladium strictum]
MSKQDPTDQVKFLVSCIGHTSNGRPDFQAVANELGIVSKAAAQKRYERMLKANGVTAKPASKDGSNSDEKSPKTSPKRKSNGDAKPKRPAAKKVKAESSSPARSETPVKDETKDEDDQTVISDSPQHDGDEI